LTNERSDQLHYALLDGGRSLQLEETHSSDSGTYACIATNLAGHIVAEIKLDVLLTPYFEEFSYKQEETVVAGTEVKFDCNVSGNPEPKVSKPGCSYNKILIDQTQLIGLTGVWKQSEVLNTYLSLWLFFLT
jgi:hypothetical protein